MKGFSACAFLIFGLLFANVCSAADADIVSNTTTDKISVVGCVTWWSHDAMGYHPSVLLKLENASSRNLTGELLRFQGRFTDVRTGYVSVARKEVRQDFANHHQIYLALRAPTAVDLPIDDSTWPAIECKVMSRIGKATDDGTQDLLITHLDAITMSDEDAFSQLAKQTGFASASPTVNNIKSGPALVASIKPLALDFAIPSSLPEIGDDFYVFEKYFGQPSPSNIVVSKEDLTWASYPPSRSFSEIIVGSRSLSGKADIIVLTLAPSLSATEQDLLSLAKALVGKRRKASLASFVHSVRYLPTGRSEINHASASDCQIVSFKLPANTKQPGKLVLAVSRMPTDLDKSLSIYTKKIPLLQVLKPGLPLETN